MIKSFFSTLLVFFCFIIYNNKIMEEFMLKTIFKEGLIVILLIGLAVFLLVKLANKDKENNENILNANIKMTKMIIDNFEKLKM